MHPLFNCQRILTVFNIFTLWLINRWFHVGVTVTIATVLSTIIFRSLVALRAFNLLCHKSSSSVQGVYALILFLPSLHYSYEGFYCLCGIFHIQFSNFETEPTYKIYMSIPFDAICIGVIQTFFHEESLTSRTPSFLFVEYTYTFLL